MNSSVQPFSPVLAFAVGMLLLRLLLLPTAQRWFLDRPNSRSLHALPTPRTGGLGMMPGILLGIALVGGLWPTVGLAAGLLFVSAADDWKGLPVVTRLTAHLAAAAGFVFLSLPGVHWWLLILLTLAVAWITDLYNFMDGADGLAAGMAMFGFGAYGVAAWLWGQETIAAASACVVAGAAAFLVFNFPPARIFMGDAGSIPLGFLAGALGLVGWREGTWPLWFPVVAFAPFVLDASVTLVRRLLRRERIWEAHRSHYYQRAILAGWSHRQTALAEYALMLGSGSVAVSAAPQSGWVQIGLLAPLALVYAVAMLLIDRRWRQLARL